MKKTVLLVLIVAAAIFFGTPLLDRSNAQERTRMITTPEIKDPEMAEEIKRVTKRTTDGLSLEKRPDGSTDLGLEHGFQNVPLAALDEEGNTVLGCAATLDEANDFFGRDLETGESLGTRYSPAEKQRADAEIHGLKLDEYQFYLELIEKAAANRANAPNAATITIVNADGADEGFNDPTPVAPVAGNNGTTLGAQRLNLFNFAAQIWGAYLDTTVPIQVRSQFNPQTCTPTSATLGSAGTTRIFQNFTNAPLSNTWYHQALANKLAGADLHADADITATFNSGLNGDPNCLAGRSFYLGFDNATPPNTVNLLLVLLHEMGHGLGFSNFANGATGALNSGTPDVYTRYMIDRTQNLGWNAMTNAQRVTSAINNGNLLWDGPNVKAASAGMTNGVDASNGRVQLYAPLTFTSGSSLSHFDTACAPNLLMEPFITTGLPLTLDLTRQQMRDIGWFRDTNGDLLPDTITGVQPSGTTVGVGSSVNVTWTNNGGFNQNVTIDLSTDGGTTFPTALATNIPNTGSFTFTVPNTLTSTARVRVREAGFVTLAGTSAANFIIATGVPTPTPTPTPVTTPSPFPEFDLSISQSAAPEPVVVGGALTYTLTVRITPTALGGTASPRVRFNFPTGVPFFVNTVTTTTNGYVGTADASGITFTGGTISTNGISPGTATLQIRVTPTASGVLTSAGSNVVVDPANLVMESNENNNTASTITSTVNAAPTPTPSPTPTPAQTVFSVEGRVLTPAGVGVRNAVVTLIDPAGIRRSATTSSFGVYSFQNLAPGQEYTMTVVNKRYRFAPRTVTLISSLTNFDFPGLE